MSSPYGWKYQNDPQVTIATVPSFDENLPKYKCCCGSIHITSAVRILVAFQLIFALFLTLLFILQLIDGQKPLWLIWVCVAVLILQSFLCHKALSTGNRILLIPLMALQIFYIISWVLNLLGIILLMLIIHHATLPEDLQKFKTNFSQNEFIEVILIMFPIIATLISLGIFYILYKCYVYLGDKSKTQRVVYSSA